MNRLILTPKDKSCEPIVFECAIQHSVGANAVQVVSWKNEAFIYYLPDYSVIQIKPVTDELLEACSDEFVAWYKSKEAEAEARAKEEAGYSQGNKVAKLHPKADA